MFRRKRIVDEKIYELLPQGVALSWGLVKQPQRGPKRELNVNQIVEAAIAIADEDGLTAVSMNRVATSLGFTPMSLYRYIPSKDDLLLLMQDAVCAIPLPPIKEEAGWRENIKEYFNACLKVFTDHPWFGDIPISGAPITPNNLQVVDWALGCIKELPLSDFEKMGVILLISNYARGCGLIQRDLNRALQSGATEGTFSGRDYSAALKQLVTSERFPHLHPIIMSGVYTEENPEANDVGDDFDFGLELILDGIDSYLLSKKGK
ncbi:TetR/AcrR family transcriptional regulator [Bacillus sp. Gen3]|uniref:TetR family transcriptional regulator n=1 Tax=Heyndrickxia oleronia TaxID=38875 RepID=A0A8E2LEP1_9BACI|nr:TetR/AcrR family transcriptional regulator [Heyndrickxia oleronia]NYV66895.1 TetR/AcrR family transcriptional regulator [Bacillus sp. Gen3]OOP67359.1 TetR family transcriptional regulator [Heyndrickxia oleronia]QQZ05207.1 TetR/AcrR family transcriptional regulator [Heyndrickxia oleronia]